MTSRLKMVEAGDWYVVEASQDPDIIEILTSKHANEADGAYQYYPLVIVSRERCTKHGHDANEIAALVAAAPEMRDLLRALSAEPPGVHSGGPAWLRFRAVQNAAHKLLDRINVAKI